MTWSPVTRTVDWAEAEAAANRRAAAATERQWNITFIKKE